MANKLIRRVASTYLQALQVPVRDPRAFLQGYSKKLTRLAREASSFTNQIHELGEEIEGVFREFNRSWHMLNSQKLVDAVLNEFSRTRAGSPSQVLNILQYPKKKHNHDEILSLATWVSSQAFIDHLKEEYLYPKDPRWPESTWSNSDLTPLRKSAAAYLEFENVLQEMGARVKANRYDESTLQAQKVETLYHVSLNAKKLYSSGFSKTMPAPDSGLGLGGSQQAGKGHKGISFTYDIRGARLMHRMMRELHDVVTGKTSLSRILDMISRSKKYEDIVHWIEYDFRVIVAQGSLRFVSRLGENIPAHEIFKKPEDVAKLYYLYLLHGGGPKIMIMDIRAFAKNLAKTSASSIGILVADVDMSHPGIGYNSGEREYRVPPGAVLGIKKLIQ